MASDAGPSLAHRSVSSIRATPGQTHPGLSTPQTPPRNIASAFGSPSTVRADDDIIVIELGSRHVRVGFAGDVGPKAILSCGLAEQRRTGDFRSWQNSQSESNRHAWSAEHEIWRYDLRGLDLGLVEDKLNRLLRDAFTKYLLIDSRPRRAGLVLDSTVPIPLLSCVLDTLFNRFQTPTVSLMSSSVMTGAAAGVRSCLIVDMGWAETVVTSVYEYREVKHTRTVRAARLLLNNVYRELSALLSGETQSSQEGTDKSQNAERLLSFAECEDVMCRLVWCRPSSLKTSRQPVQLETVEEQDESDAEAANPPHSPKGSAKIPLRSTAQPTTVEMPFEKLADICDATFFPSAPSVSTFDDDELPLHMLVYLHLLQLPLDVRAVCMSRIIFTGGGSSILGIKERVMDEVTYLVETRGWEPVTGKGAEQVRTRAKSQGQAGSMNSSSVPLVTVEGSSRSQTEPEKDPLEAKLARHRKAGPPQVQGQLRALHSLGPWVGASLLSQLRIPALSTIDRELWLQHGVSGASKPGDVDVKAQQRQSMSAGGLIRGAGGHHNWTLGAWGAL